MTESSPSNKVCPLFTMTEPNQRLVGCFGDECAWWSADIQGCSLATLAHMASYWMLNDSRDRMPREERSLLHHRLRESFNGT